MSLPYRDDADTDVHTLIEGSWYIFDPELTVAGVAIEKAGVETDEVRTISRAMYLRYAKGLYMFYVHPDERAAKDYPILFLGKVVGAVLDPIQASPS